jgi:hypothetical protein
MNKTYLKRKAVLSKSITDWSDYRHARNRYNKLVKDKSAVIFKINYIITKVIFKKPGRRLMG